MIELGLNPGKTWVYGDNLTETRMSRDAVSQQASRHFRRAQAHKLDLCDPRHGLFQPAHVKTEHNVADAFGKKVEPKKNKESMYYVMNIGKEVPAPES